MPRLGVLSGRPNPKKVSPDSIPMFPARFNVTLTMIMELKLGSTWKRMIFQFGVPNVFDAET